MALKLVSFSLKDSRSNFNKKYDLSQEVIVKQNEAILILQNILNFNAINSPNSIETVTELQVDNENIKIAKAYSTGSVKYLVNDQEQAINIYDYLSQKLNIKLDPPTWESRLIDFQNLNIQSPADLEKLFQSKDSILQINPNLAVEQQTLTTQFNQLKTSATQGLPQDQIQKIDRLIDIKFRINKIQKEVDSYQTQKESKDDLDKKIKDKELEVTTFKDKLESVSSLMKSRAQMASELQKFNVSQAPNIETLRQQKVAQTDKYLQTAYTKPARSTADDSEEEKGFNLTPKKILLIVQIPITLTVIILGYLLINQTSLLVLGAIVIILEFAFIIFEFQKREVAKESDALEPEVPQVIVQSLNADQSQDKVFIGVAWKNAYEQELNKIDQQITSNLSNKKYEEVEAEKSQKERELADLKIQLETLENNALDSEAYYKKRRELDILKIEKENLEFGSNLQIQNEQQLEELNQKMNQIEEEIYSIEDKKSQVPFIVINLKDGIKNLIAEVVKLRQIVLINNS